MLSICATMVLLVWNPYPKRVLQPIANPSKILHLKCKGTQVARMKCRNVKRGWREANYWDKDVSRGIGSHYAPLVHAVEALNQEYHFLATKSLPGTLDLPQSLGHQGSHQGSHQVLQSPWSRFSLRSFSMKDGGLHVPCTKLSTSLHTKPEGHRHTDGSILQGAGSPRYKLEVHSSATYKAQHLALFLSLTS